MKVTARASDTASCKYVNKTDLSVEVQNIINIAFCEPRSSIYVIFSCLTLCSIYTLFADPLRRCKNLPRAVKMVSLGQIDQGVHHEVF